MLFRSPTPQPVHYRLMFGSYGLACAATSITFVSQVALKEGIGDKLGLKKQLSAVKGTRTVRKADMIHNNYAPKVDVDPETYQVKADGELLTCEPSAVLPLAQRYFLF